VPEEFGPYLVYEQIGLGGMATVHRAEAHGVAGFKKAVALKRMLPSIASDASFVQSFIREARIASQLRHANVAQTYDLGKVGDTYFIAMELVTGHNLREILKHCAAVCGPMPLTLVLNILNQMCEALDYAHNLCDESGTPLGIIHRDVTPSNIIVSEGGVVKLIDFGIAKAQAAGMQTMSGTIKGKFGYMAPEYIAGRIDARADLFALGVIAHELLANRPLFQGKDDMDTLYNVRSQHVVPPSRFRAEVPAEIDAIVMTALERDPDRRWQRANALRTALTTETRRLGLAVLNNAVTDWLEWAFQQKKGNFQVDTDPSIVIESPEPQAADSLPTMIRPSGIVTLPRGSAPKILSTQPGLGPAAPAQNRTILGIGEETRGGASSMLTTIAPPKPGRTSKGILFALLVLLVAAGTAAVVYFALPYFT
jgi:serine/threonine protein kinase